MKIAVILCLAAGPLVAPAQQAARPISGRWLDSIPLGWRPPAVKIAGTANLQWSGDEKKPESWWARNSVRILMPDHMSCLVSWYPDPMLIDSRKGTDPMPNGLKRVEIVTTVR